MKYVRFSVVVLLMSFTALALYVRGDVDKVPPSDPLTELPETIGGLIAADIPLDAEVLQVLGKGDFLNRVYTSPPDATGENAKEQIPIGLFIGYFPTQRTGQSIHSPQNCLPGAGWTFETKGVTELTGPTGRHYQVGEYLITDGKVTQEVLYWYQMEGRTIASDYKAKLITLADSIRYDRTDAALVRIITPVIPGEARAEAHRRAVGFADKLMPLLPTYIPN